MLLRETRGTSRCCAEAGINPVRWLITRPVGFLCMAEQRNAGKESMLASSFPDPTPLPLPQPDPAPSPLQIPLTPTIEPPPDGPEFRVPPIDVPGQPFDPPEAPEAPDPADMPEMPEIEPD